ncbi:hypothetical protein [Levilactobacillus lindianensis]|nr:hypothetical protein [Levilactobacillus lindianensis]
MQTDGVAAFRVALRRLERHGHVGKPKSGLLERPYCKLAKNANQQ